MINKKQLLDKLREIEKWEDPEYCHYDEEVVFKDFIRDVAENCTDSDVKKIAQILVDYIEKTKDEQRWYA